MARIAGIDLPRNKRIEIALTYIYGIGRSAAREICGKADLDGSTKTDVLADAEVVRLREVIEREYKIEGGLAEHQDVDGRRVLSRPASSPRPPRSRTADAHECTDEEGAEEDRRRQEEACDEEVEKVNT
jgi:hypothetical protein